jgi:hypothetical protein
MFPRKKRNIQGMKKRMNEEKVKKVRSIKERTFVIHPDGIHWNRKTRTCYDDLVPSPGSKRIVISDSSKNEQSSLVIGQFSAWRKI